MKTNICPICVTVNSLWLVLSGGVAWGLLPSAIFILPIALLMGGTVVGIAYLGEKRYSWAAVHPQLWKIVEITGGMLLAYFFVSRLTKTVVVIEFLVLLIIAYFLFVKPSSVKTIGGNIRKLEEQMKQCC